MINENINELTSGYRTLAEKVGYEYAKIERKHKFRYLFDHRRIIDSIQLLNDYKKNNDFFPRSVEIDPSNACNHECGFCIYHSLHQKGRNEILSKNVLFRLINELDELSVKSILFVGGGEPLINKYTIDAIKLADSLGISVGLVTNGSLVIPEIAKTLKRNLTYIRFSFDAATPETHLKLHNRNDFYKIRANLENIASLDGKCTVGTGFFINEKNYTEIIENAKIVKNSGADYIQFKSYSGIEIPDNWYEDMLKILSETFILSDDNFDVHVMDRIFHNNTYQVRSYSKCHWQAFKTIIGADGNVFLCAQMRSEKKGIIGNIIKKSLKEIWKSNIRLKVIDKLNLVECPYCVHDEHNKLIEFYTKNRGFHKNFI